MYLVELFFLNGFVLNGCLLNGFLNGFVLDSRNAKYWLPMSISIWLGFECLLRPKEIAQLCFNDLRLPCDSILSYGFFSICRIRDPKNRRFFKNAILVPEASVIEPVNHVLHRSFGRSPKNLFLAART